MSLFQYIRLLMRLFVLFIFISVTIALSIYVLGPPELPEQTAPVLLDQNGDIINDMTTKRIEFEQLPPIIVDSTIIIEDKRFYQHFGFDFRRIFQALWTNVRAKQLKEGASTITQQLARNLYLTHEKTWTRKVKEAFYTLRLEMFYSKEAILTQYLNVIYYGHGAYGIEAASKRYFNKSTADLSLAEIAMMIGIPKGPTYYSPYNNLEKATDRQHFILQELMKKGIISEAEYHLAKNESLHFNPLEEQEGHFAAYFQDYVWREASERLQLDISELMQKNITIETTLNKEMQLFAEKLIEDHMEHDAELQIGLIGMEPEKGAILHMSGGNNYTKSPFNRAIDAKRMVGSTFKPFLYFTALEKGYTPTTMLQSKQTTFELGHDETYSPSNYNGYYANKPISLAQALALSDNIYAVKTNLFLGPETVAQTTEKFGITTSLPEVPSLALGSAAISLFEMVQAYSVIANQGHKVEGYAINRIVDSSGTILYEKEPSDLERVLNEQRTFILTHLMMGMFDRRLNGYMEVTGSSMIDQLKGHYAGKSGTTEADRWMIGFSPKFVAGVWMGFDDHRTLTNVAEKSLTKKIWLDIMNEFHTKKNYKDVSFHIPAGIVKEVIDVETGQLATEHCPVSRTTYFEHGTEPTEYCTEHGPEPYEVEKKEEEKNFLKRLYEWLYETKN